MRSNSILRLVSPRLVIGTGLLCCALLWASIFPLSFLFGKPLPLPHDGRLLVFPFPSLTTAWLAASLLIPMGTSFYIFRCRGKGLLRYEEHPLLYVFSPLLLLPLASFIPPFRLQVNQEVVANILFYFPVLVIGGVLFNGYHTLSLQGEGKKVTRGTVVSVGILFMLFYWLGGWYFTLSCGEHSGDEGHYIIQAKSLYQDRDLDLYNNFNRDEQQLLQKGGREHLHISPTAKEGRYYSWHPFGLPLYLSILPAGSLALRHLLLGLLAGLGSAGLLVLCGCLGVHRRTALLFVGLFSFSALWGIYASRVLPELPGAVLAIWIGVTIFSVRKHPWSTGMLLILCCGYLPFLHQRFAPISLLGYLFFIHYFLSTRQVKANWPVLAFTTSGLALLALVYLFVNARLFTTAIGYSSSQFIAEPSGMWEVLTTNQGIAYILPSFAWMFGAGLLFLFIAGHDRRYSLFALSSFFSVLALACSNNGWTGGASAMGRYLVAVAPLLLPPAAYCFERTNRVARWWFIVLSVVSVLYYFLLLVQLPKFGTSFADPRYYIGFVYDYLKGLLDPFPPARAATFLPFAGKDGYLFPLILYVLTLLLLTQKREKRTNLLYPLIIIAAAIYYHHPGKVVRWEDLNGRELSYMREQNAKTLMDHYSERSLILARKPEQRFSLFEASNAFSAYQEGNIAAVTTDPSRKRGAQNIIFQPDMPANDWSGESYFWTTLGKRLATGPVKSAFSLSGTVSGDVAAHIVVVELGGNKGRILFEETYRGAAEPVEIRIAEMLHPSGDGIVHVLVRLSEGEGTFTARSMGWSPANAYLMEQSSAYLSDDFSGGAIR